jgi:hypothetical protein
MILSPSPGKIVFGKTRWAFPALPEIALSGYMLGKGESV